MKGKLWTAFFILLVTVALFVLTKGLVVYLLPLSIVVFIGYYIYEVIDVRRPRPPLPDTWGEMNTGRSSVEDDPSDDPF